MYHLTNDITTVRALAHQIAGVDNFMLYLAPIYGPHIKPGTLGAWIASNGDPVYLATYSPIGEVLWDAAMEPGAEEWLPETLAAFGWNAAEVDLHAEVAAFLER